MADFLYLVVTTNEHQWQALMALLGFIIQGD
jgi:hypothetical protein